MNNKTQSEKYGLMVLKLFVIPSIVFTFSSMFLLGGIIGLFAEDGPLTGPQAGLIAFILIMGAAFGAARWSFIRLDLYRGAEVLLQNSNPDYLPWYKKKSFFIWIIVFPIFLVGLFLRLLDTSIGIKER